MKKVLVILLCIVFSQAILSAQSLTCQSYKTLRIRYATNDDPGSRVADMHGSYWLNVRPAHKDGWWKINSTDAGERYVGLYVYYTHLCVYNIAGASIYQYPDTHSQIVFTFRDDNALYPIDKIHGWTKVKTMEKGREGWIRDDFLY